MTLGWADPLALLGLSEHDWRVAVAVVRAAQERAQDRRREDITLLSPREITWTSLAPWQDG